MSLKKDLNKEYVINVSTINKIKYCFVKDNKSKILNRRVTLMHLHDDSVEIFKNAFITHGEEYCDDKDLEKNIIKLCLECCDPFDYNIKYEYFYKSTYVFMETSIIINNIHALLEVHKFYDTKYSNGKYSITLRDYNSHDYIASTILDKKEVPTYIINFCL